MLVERGYPFLRKILALHCYPHFNWILVPIPAQSVCADVHLTTGSATVFINNDQDIVRRFPQYPSVARKEKPSSKIFSRIETSVRVRSLCKQTKKHLTSQHGNRSAPNSSCQRFSLIWKHLDLTLSTGQFVYIWNTERAM